MPIRHGFIVFLYNMRISKRISAALAKANYDLFAPIAIGANNPVQIISKDADPTHTMAAAGALPTVIELYMMFDRFNQDCFQGRLVRPKIAYSARMMIAGSFTPTKNEIKIGRKYHEIFPEEVADTLKHEMIHMLFLHHDQNFKEVARRIGTSLKARSHPLLRSSPKYLYVCPGCGREYPRRKRLRMASCGVCSKGGKFDQRFKLVPAKSRNN